MACEGFFAPVSPKIDIPAAPRPVMATPVPIFAAVVPAPGAGAGLPMVFGTVGKLESTPVCSFGNLSGGCAPLSILGSTFLSFNIFSAAFLPSVFDGNFSFSFFGISCLLVVRADIISSCRLFCSAISSSLLLNFICC